MSQVVATTKEQSVSQLAEHVWVGYFNGTNGQNSAVLSPTSHDGEPRTEGGMGSKSVSITRVYHSHSITSWGCDILGILLLSWCIILGKSLSCNSGGDRQACPTLLTLWADSQHVGVFKNYEIHTPRPTALRVSLQAGDKSDDLSQVRLGCTLQGFRL